MEVKGDEPRGPRLEVRKHKAAEMRLKRSILTGKPYEGKEEDLELVRRKHRELSREKLREVGETIAEAGGGGGG